MAIDLLATYLDDRIKACSALAADAPDEESRQVYLELVERYIVERKRIVDEPANS